MPKEIIWNWKPLESVGLITFGEYAPPIVAKYNLDKLYANCKSGDWDAYQFPNTETYVCVENFHIISVGCYDNIFYQDKNLIGLSLDEIRAILGKEDEISEIVGTQIPIEYENLSLILWLKDKIIVGANCSRLIEE